METIWENSNKLEKWILAPKNDELKNWYYLKPILKLVPKFNLEGKQ